MIVTNVTEKISIIQGAPPNNFKVNHSLLARFFYKLNVDFSILLFHLFLRTVFFNLCEPLHESYEYGFTGIFTSDFLPMFLLILLSFLASREAALMQVNLCVTLSLSRITFLSWKTSLGIIKRCFHPFST